jgi:hypothetical protein
MRPRLTPRPRGFVEGRRNASSCLAVLSVSGTRIRRSSCGASQPLKRPKNGRNFTVFGFRFLIHRLKKRTRSVLRNLRRSMLRRRSVILRKRQNPFSGELAAMAHTLSILPRLRFRNIVLLTSNKAAVLTLRKPRQQSGQAYIRYVYDCVRRLRKDGNTVTVLWTPFNDKNELKKIAKENAQEATRLGSVPQARYNSQLQVLDPGQQVRLTNKRIGILTYPLISRHFYLVDLEMYLCRFEDFLKRTGPCPYYCILRYIMGNGRQHPAFE